MKPPDPLGDPPCFLSFAAILHLSCCNAAPPARKLTLPAQAGARIFFALAAALLALAALHPASAQQPYGNGGYGSSYSAPSSGYVQPQYTQPNYTQPQPQQPQYGSQDYGQFPDENQAQQLSGAATAQPQALSAAQLEQLLAPVALYPDQLLAQVLTAATYPAQVAAADEWLTGMRAQGYSEDQIAAGADAETGWDPSIKALTAFPDVLDTLNRNLSWTTELGNAYYNQPQDVMQTVQVLRERAQAAGNLQTTPQETVTDDQGYVGIQPANPEVVYVPVYNPWVAYGAPFDPYPGFSFFGALANFWGSGVRYGLGFGMAAFDRTPFGLLSWALNWLSQAVLFHHDNYWTSSTSVADWGLPHGGRRYHAGEQFSRAGAGSYRSGASYRIGTNWNRSNWNRTGSGNARSPETGSSRPEPARSWANRNSPQNLSAPQSRTESQGYGNRAQPFDHREQATNRGFGGTASAQGSVRPAYRYGPSGQPAQSFAARPGQSAALRQQNLAPQAYTNRPGFSYANSSPVYRAASPQAARGFSQPRSFAPAGTQRLTGYTGREPKGFASAPKSFASGRAPREFGGGKAPKGFKAPKAPKGFGGGKALKAPKAAHEGGHHGRSR